MSRHQGFTLIELVVVIMVLGILAAVAVPKYLSTYAEATDNGLRHTLSVVRDAIELYASENGGNLPPSSSAEDFRASLEPYLCSGFPKCPVGPCAGHSIKEININFGTDDSYSPPPSRAWYFNTTTGHFFVNYDGATASDPSITYDQL